MRSTHTHGPWEASAWSSAAAPDYYAATDELLRAAARAAASSSSPLPKVLVDAIGKLADVQNAVDGP